MQDKKSAGFVKTVENIWYHYKFIIIVAVCVLVAFSFAEYQAFMKKDPDVFVYHISTSGLTAMSKDEFRDSMSLIAEDYNEDGNITVDLKEDVWVPSLESVMAGGDLSSTDSFNLELAMGECIIYIMDKNFYETNKQYMADIEKSIGFLPEFAYDDKAILLTDLPASWRLPGFDAFSEDSYICLREKRVGMDKVSYEKHVKFFKKLIEYRP